MVQHRWWISALIGLVAVALLPVAGHWIRGRRAGRCALDGMAVQPIWRVRVVNREGEADEFCCIRCAEVWLQRMKSRPEAIFVTDEVTGREIDSSRAYFVRSTVVTMPHTGNRVHVFHQKAESEKHAAVARGKALVNGERPLQLE
jgi:hypothetical protein